jgi:hypothetical protein
MVDCTANDADGKNRKRHYDQGITSVVHACAPSDVNQKEHKDDVAPGVPRLNGEEACCKTG